MSSVKIKLLSLLAVCMVCALPPAVKAQDDNSLFFARQVLGDFDLKQLPPDQRIFIEQLNQAMAKVVFAACTQNYPVKHCKDVLEMPQVYINNGGNTHPDSTKD